MKVWLVLLFLGMAVVCIEGQKCGQKKPCTNSNGNCQLKKYKCDGKVIKGGKYCKNPKSCQCCVKPKECGKPAKCNAENGKCQKKNDKCEGTKLGGKKYCASNKCRCCITDPVCTPKCLNGGICKWENTCVCPPEYTGKACEIPVCDPMCQNGGMCTAPDTCTCTKEWTGALCEIPVCDPVCANGGTCTAPNTCACAEGWTGPTCEIPICDPECMNGGKCIAPNTCECILFWGGPTCAVVDSAKCSLDYVAESGVTKYWETPGYDGTTHYPEGDYCCWLNVTIPDTYKMFMVTLEMSDPAKIHETNNCAGDRVYYYPSSGSTSTLCGSLAGSTWTETAVKTFPLSFAFEWCSSLSDGGTDIGFKMTITNKDLVG